MTEAETNRIASLTTGAVKSTAESAIKAMLAAVEAAEEKTREMRAAVEEYIKEFEEGTNSLSENVTAHVSSCQSIIDSFQAHHLKILNVEPKVAEVDSNLVALRRIADATEGDARRVQG
jgi:predicted component of type VI protein secretion system